MDQFKKNLRLFERAFVLLWLSMFVVLRFTIYSEMSGSEFFKSAAWLYAPLFILVGIYRFWDRIIFGPREER